MTKNLGSLNDRWLWLGFGVFFATAAYSIRYAIRDTLKLTEIDPSHVNHGEVPSDRSEDYVSLSTLKTLAASPNQKIADSAISMIVSRVARHFKGDLAAQALADDLSSPDETVRNRARTAMAFLRDFSMDSAERIPLPWAPTGGPSYGFEVESASGESDRGSETDAPDRTAGFVDERTELADPTQHPPATFRGWLDAVNVRLEAVTDDADITEPERRRRRREAVVMLEDGETQEGGESI